VLLCLINNAVEAMSGQRAMASAEDHSCQKKRQMCLSTQYRDNRVVVRVEDTGPGIPEEGLELIFDPFYSKKKQMGLGVGLSICHGIVSDHNGTITAGNKPGGGAVFEITLPVK
jgi:C4-dicarboxylate-specific signal transduction histidine kinase